MAEENLHFPKKFTPVQVDLMNHFRLLWEQHDVWTRATIVSLVFDLPNTQPVVARLLRNPVDFELILQSFYGRKIAAGFRELLTEHLTLAADIVMAAKIGDEAALAESRRLWYANALDIARLLGRINPFWSKEEWRGLMFHHLDLVEAEAVLTLTGQHQQAVDVYDEIEEQSLVMADVMSQGIIRQFHIK